MWGALGVVLVIGGKPAAKAIKHQFDLNKLHPEMRRRVEAWIADSAAAGYEVGITETLRGAERQKELETGGKSTVKTSYHQSGLAIDFVVRRTPSGKITPFKETPQELAALSAVAQIGKRNGMRWGGDWKSFRDGYHLEIDTPLRITEAFARYQSQGPAFALTGLPRYVVG